MINPRDCYCTPRLVTDRLPPGIDIDPCSNPWSTVPARMHVMLPSWKARSLQLPSWKLWTMPQGGEIVWGDGLEIALDGLVAFANVPFSDPEPWALKLASEPKESCFLAHEDSSTKWWRYITVRRGWLFKFRDRLEYDPPPGIEVSKDETPSCMVMTNGFRDMCGSRFDDLGQWWKRV